MQIVEAVAAAAELCRRAEKGAGEVAKSEPASGGRRASRVYATHLFGQREKLAPSTYELVLPVACLARAAAAFNHPIMFVTAVWLLGYVAIAFMT